MPKLPSAEDFTRPTPSAQRSIVSYQSGQVGKAISGLGATVGAIGDMFEKEQDRLDDIRAEDALNKAKQRALELAEGDDGFTRVKGEGVINKPVREDYNKRFANAMKEIESGLGNARQIDKFRRRAQPLQLKYQGTLMRHIGQEANAYQDQTDAATLDIETQEAVANWANPQAIADSKARIQYTVNRAAERKGLSGEAKQQALNDQLTKMHKGVIASMLEVNPSEARNYYKANKKEINGLERAGIEGAIKAGSVKLESQSATDSIMGMAMTEAESIKHARQKYKGKPEIRDEVVSRLKVRFGEVNEAEKDAINEAEKIVRRDKSTANIPPQIMETLRSGDLVRLENNARSLREGIEPVHDDLKWYEFEKVLQRAHAGDQEARKQIIQANIHSEYRSHFDDAHYEKAVAVQTAFIKGDAEALAKSKNEEKAILKDRAAADVHLNVLFGRKTNAKRSTDEQKFAAQFYTLLQEENSAWIKANKKELPPTERDRIIRELLISVPKDVMFGLYEKDVDITDIPTDALRIVAEELRANNKAVNGPNLLRLYEMKKEAGEL